MREILFRGKRLNSGEWAYGDLFTCDDEMEIYSESHGENGGWVIPETVGEYTGLTDKNGVKIFEGDILRNSLDSFTAIVKWGLPHTGFVLEMKGTVYAFTRMGSEIYEVIGNIYDNPELIEDMNIKPAAKMSDTLCREK